MSLKLSSLNSLHLKPHGYLLELVFDESLDLYNYLFAHDLQRTVDEGAANMIRPNSLVSYLTCYLLVIMSCTPLRCFALENAFPPGYPNIGGPPGYTAAQRAVFLRTFQDGLDLAKHTVLFWPCDPANDEVCVPWYLASTTYGSFCRWSA
jgi:hypothetical protein